MTDEERAFFASVNEGRDRHSVGVTGLSEALERAFRSSGPFSPSEGEAVNWRAFDLSPKPDEVDPGRLAELRSEGRNRPVSPPAFVRDPIRVKRDCGAYRGRCGELRVTLSGSARHWLPYRSMGPSEFVIPASAAWSVRSALEWLDGHLTPEAGHGSDTQKGYKILRHVVHSRVVPALLALFRVEGGREREADELAKILGGA